jgi:hypothetical protein
VRVFRIASIAQQGLAMASMRKTLLVAALAMALCYVLSGVNFTTMKGVTARPPAPRYDATAKQSTYETAKESTYESFQSNNATEEAQATRPWTSVLAIAVSFGLVMGFMQAPASAQELQLFAGLVGSGGIGVIVGLPIVGAILIALDKFPGRFDKDDTENSEIKKARGEWSL